MKLTPKIVIISIIAAPFVLVIGADYASRISQNLSSTKPSTTPSPIATSSVTPRTPVKSYADEYVPEYKAPAQVDDDPALKYALEAKKALELAKEDAELAEIEAAMMSTPEAKADLKLQKARAESFDAMIEQDQKDNPERWVNSTPYVKSADRYKNR